MKNISYIVIFTLAIEVLLAVAIYAYKRRGAIDEMHGMMIGMTLGMFSGLVTATLFLIPTGNFLNGVIIGSLVGLAFGMPLGRLGGHLGVMEGVMAGPMGGMMGAMLGLMIRPFSIEVFIPFFIFILLLTMIGITYAVQCKCNHVKNPGHPDNNKISDQFLMSWTLPVILLLVLSVMLPFPIGTSSSTSNPFTASAQSLEQSLEVAASSRQQKAVVKDDVQEVDLEVNEQGGYSPETIIAKKDVPLKINFSAKISTCAAEIVFPDLDIDEIAPVGSPKVIKIDSPKAGTYIYRCPMDMVRGQLIVK